ncbi:17865_t:CDS:2 [Acaulospora morrowiae]|uniref:Signal peptidase complex subunit 2 n=1 Tax=Acaulospora morrowiae TaxID=94023 RepID=A0A9N8YS85_9GLOM|nr:17865_t:CDS:2 [Acaulospora morrowiae]
MRKYLVERDRPVEIDVLRFLKCRLDFMWFCSLNLRKTPSKPSSKFSDILSLIVYDSQDSEEDHLRRLCRIFVRRAIDQKQEQIDVVEKEKDVIKVNNYCVTDLKNACDDYIIKYFTTEAGYNQVHTHTDVKLVLGYLACGFALSGGYYGYMVPFEESKKLTLICILAYFILNSILFVYAFVFEKDVLFVGCDSNFKISIHTNAKRSSDIYTIKFELVEEKKINRVSNYSISKSFGSWFDVNGVMDQERFERTLNESLEVVKTGKKPHDQ